MCRLTRLALVLTWTWFFLSQRVCRLSTSSLTIRPSIVWICSTTSLRGTPLRWLRQWCSLTTWASSTSIWPSSLAAFSLPSSSHWSSWLFHTGRRKLNIKTFSHQERRPRSTRTIGLTLTIKTAAATSLMVNSKFIMLPLKKVAKSCWCRTITRIALIIQQSFRKLLILQKCLKSKKPSPLGCPVNSTNILSKRANSVQSKLPTTRGFKWVQMTN